MTPRRARIYASVFSLLTASVAANVLLLQPRVRPAGQQTAEVPSSAPGSSQYQTAAIPKPKLASPQASAEAGPATVRAIQRELKAAGHYDGPVDGIANLSTHAAVMSYESDHGLQLTGVPSDALLKTLILGTDGRAGVPRSGLVVRGTPAEQVTRLVQQLLTGRGYNIGAVDGRLGEDTRRAIQAFETAQRLPPSGRISAALVTRLQRTATTGKVASGR
jgi:peptidoglycan hydrolase-like protein with peptidoglycan-binding domain